MPNPLEESVREALKKVRFAGMNRDILSFGFVRFLKADGGAVTVELEVSSNNSQAVRQLQNDVEAAVTAVDGVVSADVRVQAAAAQTPQRRAQAATARDPNLIPDVRHVVAVASGKGGVGKSTVAANLAVSLAALGHSTGLLDADIYGPSVPTMLGIHERPVVIENRLQPFEKLGLRIMSLGFVLDQDTPVIWRGPMVMRAIEQMLGDVDWGELDYLIVDMPPGTGDAQLTLSQKVPLSGAVIVTTPQDVALIDARKGLAMFRKVNVPVVGLVENMSTFVCPHCGETTDVFRSGGGERVSKELGVPLLGKIPLDPAIVEGGDSGTPIAAAEPDGPHGEAFRAIAEAVAETVGRRKKRKLSIF